LEQVAAWLSVSVATARRLVKRSELPSKRIGRRLYVPGWALRADTNPPPGVAPQGVVKTQDAE
jgi:hypothetical protein